MELGSTTDVTVIRDLSKTLTSAVTACCWWHSWSGIDYGELLTMFTLNSLAIIASNSGNLRIIDLRNRESVKISCRFSVEKMDLIVDPEKTFKVTYFNLHSLISTVSLIAHKRWIFETPTWTPNWQKHLRNFAKKTKPPNFSTRAAESF